MRTEQIVKLLGEYKTAFPHSKVEPASLIVYAKCLKGLSMAELEGALLNILATSKFFPSVAEILEQAKAIRETASGKLQQTGADAWEEVMSLAKDKGPYQAWEYSSPEVEQAVKQFGRVELCTLEMNNVNTARAQFMKIYNGIHERRNKQDLNQSTLNMLGPAKIQQLMDSTVRQIGL